MDNNPSHSQNTNRNSSSLDISEVELIYLIAKYLSVGPCKKSYEVLKTEIEENKILPKRIDWLGNEHERTYNDFDSQNSHIAQDFLLQVVSRLEPTIQKLWPTFPAKKASLLGRGSQSLLRSDRDSEKSYRTLSDVLVRQRGNPIIEPTTLKGIPNATQAAISREICGSTNRKHFLTNKLYSRLQLFVRNVGHLSAVYCMLFDRCGRYIITGADDMLVKIWSVIDGRLVATLRGASAEISDLALDQENTLIAAGSCDKIIRVWSLQTLAPVAVLSSHTGMITALQFCPKPDKNGVLVSTGGDGCVAFWTYTRRNLEVKFDPKPLKLNERVRPGHAQLICASFSTGGNFLAVGGADHFVRVYKLGGSEGIDKLLETEIHTDRVDSIQWCHSGVGFVSGSRDGTALIWRYHCQEWKTTILNMRQMLTGFTTVEEGAKKLQVTMVGWDRTDSLVITASSDHFLRVWDSRTGVLKKVLEGHEDNAYVIEAHPTDNRLILTAGHDGLLFIWDVIAGVAVKRFKNSIEGQGHGALFDAKWSPDGLGISTTDSHGHILIFGIGDNELFKKIPQELFFHTDYRPLVRDQNHHILDEQTQMAPHLMPPPFLVNIDGDPYPPEFQRLVPGRENCRMDQLIPNVVTNDNGDQEVLDLGVADLEPPPPPPPPLQVRQNESNNREVLFGRPNIDDMIERLAQERHGRRGPSERGGRDEEPGPSNLERRGSTSGGGAYPDHSYAVAPLYDPLSPRAGRVGARREGDIEGVRQSTGNWQRDPHMKWKRQLCLVPLTDGALEQSKIIRREHGELELILYEEEGKKGPDTPQLKRDEEEGGERESRRYRRRQKKPHTSAKASKVTPPKTRRGRQGAGRGRPSGRQAASRAPVPTAQSTFGDDFEDPDAAIASQEREEEGEQEEEDEEEEAALSLSSSSSSSSLAKEALEEEEESSSEDSDNSTDYSDWTADFGGAGLEPPKRTAHKQKRNPVPVKRKKRRAKKEEGKDESEEEVEREEKEEKKVKRERRKRGEKEEEKRPSNARRKRDARNMNMAESDGDGGDIEEIPPEYRPPEWLGETVPKKAPYFPQMGDEIMYFRQGHQLYVEAVLNRQLYQVDKRSLPWIRKHNLRDQEYVKIIGTKYEIKPPRLCCLKLGIMDLDGNLTGDAFTIKYHDMPDVLDFLVLKTTYDAAVSRNWQVEDRFRCIIDDAWWIGTVEAQEPHLPEFPDSMFMCYRVLWDNGERERLSPWDMEFIDDQMKLPDIGGSIRVCPAEYKNLVYTPSPEEWAGSSFESECQRMAEGIGKLMELAVAEPFLTPVDLNVYPHYALIVEYPMDLSTIKSRLESHFYRRPNAAQFDVRYIATNAEKFNKKGTVIVKHARIITDLALGLIKDPTCRDPTIYYHEVQNSYQSPSHSEDEAGISRRLRQDSEEEKTRRRTSGRTKEALRSPRDGTIILPKLGDNRPWQQQCRDLLKSMFERQDSTPFRFPVDVNRYEDYYQVIDVPMDLSTIREELAAGGYASPLDFAKDVRLVFQNSKNYNTNNKSRIYSMTVRLEAFFEDQIKGIFARCKNKEDSRTSSPLAGPSGSGTDLLTTRMKGGRYYDYSDADEDYNNHKLRGSVNEGGKRRSRRVAKLRQLRVNDSDDTDSDDEEYSPQKRSPQKARDKTISSKTHPGSSKASQGRKSVSPATAVERRERGGPMKRTSGRRARGNDSDFEAPVKRSASSAPTLRPKRSRRYEEDSDFETNSPPSPPPEPSSEEEEEEKEEETKWKVRKRRSAQKPPTVSHRSLRGSTKKYVKSETSSENEDVVAVKQNGEGGHSIGFKRRIESSDEEEKEAVVNGIKEDSTWSIVKKEDEDEDEEEEEEKENEEEENGVEEEEENGTEEEDGSEDEESDEKDEEVKQPPETTQKLRLTLASFRGRKKTEESDFECDDEELEDDESEDEEEEEADKAEKKKKGGQRGRRGGVPRRLRPKPVDGDDVEEDVDFVADFIDDEEASSTSSTEADSEDDADSRRKKKSKKKKMTQKEKEKKEEETRKERVKRAKALARERAKTAKVKAKALEKVKKARQKAKEKEKAKKAKEDAKRVAKAAKEANVKMGKGGRKKGSKDETVTINSKVNFTTSVTGQLHHSPSGFQVPHPSTGPQLHHPTASPQLHQPAFTHQVQMRIAPQMSHLSQGSVNLQMHHTPISPRHIRPINPQVRHVPISHQMHQSSVVRAQIYHSTAAPSHMYQTSPPPQIQYSPTTSRIHQAQVVAPLIQAPDVQQQFIVPANTYTSPINAYNSLPSYVPIAPNPHQPALIAYTATSQPPPPYSSPPSLTQIPLTFDSRTQAKQVIHGGRVIGTKITQIGPISGSSGVVSGLSNVTTGSSVVATGSPVVVTGSSGTITGSSGVVTGSSVFVTGSSGVDTGSSMVVTGSSGAATGSFGVVTESSSSSSDDDEDFEPGSYIANGSWGRTRTRRGRIEEDSEEDEVGKRGRVRKKVRYNEDSEEGEASNSVSSRGRVRRANTRMKDFI